jgi:chemotaxis response regulator CheB
VQKNAVIRVLVVDYDGRVCRALSHLIDTADDMRVVGTAASASQARAAFEKVAFDVILLDVLLPSLAAGTALVRHLSRDGQMVVATSVSGAVRNAALDAGAACFIEKGPDPSALLAALRHWAEPARHE